MERIPLLDGGCYYVGRQLKHGDALVRGCDDLRCVSAKVLINPNCRRHGLAFVLVQCIINNRTILKRYLACIHVHVGKRMFSPMLLSGFGGLTFKRLCVIELINTNLWGTRTSLAMKQNNKTKAFIIYSENMAMVVL